MEGMFTTHFVKLNKKISFARKMVCSKFYLILFTLNNSLCIVVVLFHDFVGHGILFQKLLHNLEIFSSMFI